MNQRSHGAASPRRSPGWDRTWPWNRTGKPSRKPLRLPGSTHDPWTGPGGYAVKCRSCRRRSRSGGSRQASHAAQANMPDPRGEQLPGGKVNGRYARVSAQNYAGRSLGNLWTDIPNVSGKKERLGYATQKPVALLERIISASSNPNDVGFDPFCGRAQAGPPMDRHRHGHSRGRRPPASGFRTGPDWWKVRFFG